MQTRSLLHVLKYLVFAAGLIVGGAVLTANAQPSDKEPIAYTGHGAMFNQQGKEVAPSLSFINEAQTWYRNYLVKKLNERQRAQFGLLENRMTKGLELDEQSRLVANANLIDWLIKTVKTEDSRRIQRMNNLLRSHLQSALPKEATPEQPRSVEPFKLHPVLEKRLQTEKLLAKKLTPKLLVTNTSGQQYIDICRANGVPIPPNVGGPQWVNQGDIPKSRLFIVPSMDARVQTWVSPPPVLPTDEAEGMCVALPRYITSGLIKTVQLDGVICVGKVSSKVCFWDNEKNGVANTFTLGTTVPLLDFGGGTQLLGDINLGGGGVCSDCHAGENPFIIHPDPPGTPPAMSITKLGALKALGLPTFPNNWYDPIVRTGDTKLGGAPLPWPENPGPMNGPADCTVCHEQGNAGRFPHLSNGLQGYCGTILAQAITRTMPPGAPGSLANDPAVLAMQAWCNQPPSGNPSGRGDPHITTSNGVQYDFQSAGEFVYLRAGNGLEIQTRQTPVSTASVVGPNAHTGLTSCVSINTAVAARVGKHRVTFQPNPDVEANRRGLQVRIDGKLVELGNQAINLGGGGRVTRAAAGGGIDIDFPDKTRMSATPGFWGAPNNVWFINVDVFNTPGREGIMGAILPGNWLPLLPDGASMGAKPALISQRYNALYGKFADAWRVDDKSSLFDYTPGSSTKTFTDKAWPPEKPPCIVPGSTIPPAAPMNPRRAEEVCGRITDKNIKAECVFDVTVTGNAGFAKTYLLNQQLKQKFNVIKTVLK